MPSPRNSELGTPADAPLARHPVSPNADPRTTLEVNGSQDQSRRGAYSSGNAVARPSDMRRSVGPYPKEQHARSLGVRHDSSPERARKRRSLGRAIDGDTDESSEHSKGPGEKTPTYRSIMQRRGPLAMSKAPNLHLDTFADQPRTRELLYSHEKHPPACSAPPNQLQFGREARLPSPPSLFHARDCESARIPPFTHYHSSEHEAYRRGSYVNGEQEYISTPNRARLFAPQTAVLSSPAYHTSHFGQNFHAMHDQNTRDPNQDRRGNDASESEQGAPLPRSPVANKMQFLSLFSDFFDSLSDSRTLKATLEHQIRSSNTLLQTLQRSSKVFDETVERRIRHESDVMESRLARLEGKVDDAIRRMDEAIASLTKETTQNATNSITASQEK